MERMFKRVLSMARRCEHFFDMSGDERVRWMVERAYRLGRAEVARRFGRRGRRRRPATNRNVS